MLDFCAGNHRDQLGSTIPRNAEAESLQPRLEDSSKNQFLRGRRQDRAREKREKQVRHARFAPEHSFQRMLIPWPDLKCAIIDGEDKGRRHQERYDSNLRVPHPVIYPNPQASQKIRRIHP
ncbi:MAG: hypothetical protein NVSMB9_00350 [Isosphaeraceae bacterium]